MTTVANWLRAATLAYALVLAACAVDEPTISTAEASLTLDTVDMQILAHEDDDILFMNPDLRNSVLSGHGIVSVYITAGQASGVWSNSQCTYCAAEFANSRQLAVKGAYAQMMTGDRLAPWTRQLIVPDPGTTWPHTVELYTLNAAPWIRLIFMNVPDAGSQAGVCDYPPYTNALNAMHDDPSFVTNTIVPDCGPVQGAHNTAFVCNGANVTNPFMCDSFEGCPNPVPWQNYDHPGVVAVLSGLIGLYQPMSIRTLDPEPLSINGAIDYDNIDHTGAARFVDEVLASYHGPNNTGRFTVSHYKGYGQPAYPAIFGPSTASTKQATALAYAVNDPNYALGNYVPYYSRVYERYPATTRWIERSGDGRLVAISVEDRALKMWYENSIGGTWTGPVTIYSGTPVAPAVTLLRRPDGLLQVFATRLPLERETWNYVPQSAPQQDVITAVQNAGSMSFGPWQSLGGVGGVRASTGTINVAVTTSSNVRLYSPYSVLDGSLSTHWLSSASDPQWITLDLGATYQITRITLRWSGNLYASAFRLQVSNDNTNWTDVKVVTNGSGGVNDYASLTVSGRYVRMYGQARRAGSLSGYGLSEFEVYTTETGQITGTATAAIDGTGRVFVFGKNSQGKLAYTYSTGSTWAPWYLFNWNDQDIMDGIAAITRDDGVVEVFATQRSGQIQHFVQNGTSSAFITSPLGFVAASPPTVAKNQDGRLELFFREVADPADDTKYGRVVTAWVNTSGTWVGGDASYPGAVLYGDAGSGPIAAMRRDNTGHIMVFERNGDHRVSATWQLSPNSSFSTQWWVFGAPGPGQIIQELPSATTDGAGRAVVIVKGPDGKLYIARETSSGSFGNFGSWTLVGN